MLIPDSYFLFILFSKIMAETKQDNKTFKWGEKDYLLDDFLKMHAEQENYFYNFARDKGKLDDNAIGLLRTAINDRINHIKSGNNYAADGVLDTDKVQNVSVKTKKGLFKKDKYTEQDITEWAKYYVDKLLRKMSPGGGDKKDSAWDISKHGLEAYLTGQGLNPQEIFERYDLQDASNPGAARSYDQRKAQLKKYLPGYMEWLSKKGFDFSKNDNDWDDSYLADLEKFIKDFDSLDINDITSSLRKFGAGDQYTTAFTSNRWDLTKPASQSAAEAQAAADKKKQEEEEKLKAERLREFEDYAYGQRRNTGPVYYAPFDYSGHDFQGKEANFRNWYGDLSESERSKYGTYLGTDNEKWNNAWISFTDALKNGSAYEDKNAGILLQGALEKQPHLFIQLNDGKYLIRDSITDSGQGTVYDPSSGYTSSVFLGDIATQNEEIANAYRDLAHRYINQKYGTDYNTRQYVFAEGGSLVPKHQYGNAVAFNWEGTNSTVAPKAANNGIDVETQKAKDQYLDSDNKSVDNPNAGWDAKHTARLSFAIADLGSAVAAFAPGGGTIASAALGVSSSLGNFFTDMADDAVTRGEMWRNLGLNLGMDIVGLIPGGGAATKMGKILKTLKSTVPLIVALPGVASMLKNSPEIAESWKKAFDGDADKGGSKMTYQDYMNILQVLNVAAGATTAGRNIYKTKTTKTPKVKDAIAVDVTTKGGQRKAIVFEGEDAKKFRSANDEGKAQEFINKVEGEGVYTINEITKSNWGKFWGKDPDGNFEWRNPLGTSGTGKANVVPLRRELVTDFWGRPKLDNKGNTQTQLYADPGRWKADLSGDDLVMTKGKPTFEAWRDKTQKQIEADFDTWRQKAAHYKTRTDQAATIKTKLDSDIATQTKARADLEAKAAETQKTIDEASAEATRIQEWLDGGGVDKARKVQKSTLAEIKRKEAKLKTATGYERTVLKREIADLKKIEAAAQAEIYANTPEAVLAAREKFDRATSEKSKLQAETDKLDAMLERLTRHQRYFTSRAAAPHSDAYTAIRDFKPIQKKYKKSKHTFDVAEELKSLEGLYKQGGSINRNKINKFLNYAKR